MAEVPERRTVHRPRPPLTRAARLAGAATIALAVAASAGCALKRPYLDARFAATAPDGRVVYRLLLIGDAGEPREPEPVLTQARLWAGRERGRSSVIFLGDNAYPRGLVPGHIETAKAKLARQIDAFADVEAPVTFVPGNHDWDDGGTLGLAAIVDQAAFVSERAATFLPTAGCPGPEVRDLPSPEAPVLRVVAIDTQWFLHRHARGSGCQPESVDGFEAQLRNATNTSLPLVVVGHHPLASHGRHGGFHPGREHLFPLGEIYSWGKWIPLPILGTLFPIARSMVDWPQDLASPKNRQMRWTIERALASATTPALKIYAAGHDHSLQVLTHAAVDYALVSGAGSSEHETGLSKGYDTLYASPNAGFMVLDVLESGFRLSVVDVEVPADTPVSQFALRRRR